MLALLGLMSRREGGPNGASYSQATANGNSVEGLKRSTFEPPPDLRLKLLVKETFKDQDMDIDPDNATIPTTASTPWMLRKYIPQAPQAPKYIIISPRIEEQKQYMRDYALVGKFLGLWASERDLIKWIQYCWKPK